MVVKARGTRSTTCGKAGRADVFGLMGKPQRGMERSAADPAEAAHEAGLVYTSDLEPGIRRVRNGRGFLYIAPGGARVRDPAELDRIRSLAIPPAWKDVWICAR